MKPEHPEFVLTPPDPAIKAHFSTIPWCKAYYDDPTLIPIGNPMITALREEPVDSTRGTLFTQTLASPNAIKYAQWFYRPPRQSIEQASEQPGQRQDRSTIPTSTSSRDTRTSELNGPPPNHPELINIYTLGTGLNGHRDVAHGGFVALLLDQSLGTTGKLHRPVDKKSMTAYLTTNYKSPILTPGTVSCRSWCEKKEGRKIFAKGVVERDGQVLASADGLFVIIEKKEARELGKL